VSDRVFSTKEGIWSWCLRWIRAVQVENMLSADGGVGVAVFKGEEEEV